MAKRGSTRRPRKSREAQNGKPGGAGSKKKGRGGDTPRPAASSEEDWSARTAKTPLGRIWLVARGDRLWGAELEARWPQLSQRLLSRHGVNASPGQTIKGNRPVLERAVQALTRYFAGELQATKKVELDLEGSSLQRRVWDVLGKIAPGDTITYGELAIRARQKGAFRAVGAANGANPCAIFVPCHRVVSTTGALQGYGGGLEAKSWLLKHEGVANDGWQLVT